MNTVGVSYMSMARKLFITLIVSKLPPPISNAKCRDVATWYGQISRTYRPVFWRPTGLKMDMEMGVGRN